MKNKPFGIIILFIVYVVLGIATLIDVLLKLLSSLFLLNIISTLASIFNPVTVLTIFIRYDTIVNALFIIAGLLELLASYGLWTGKKWSKWIVIALAAMVLIDGLLITISWIPHLSAVGLGIIYVIVVDIIIPIIIIYYLTRKQIKLYFEIRSTQS